MYYFLIVGMLVLSDQLIKWFVKTNLTLNQSVPVIQDIFHITYIKNNGAAFSILQGKQPILIGITTVFIIVLLVLIWSNKRKGHWSFLVSLTLITAGGIGNLIDRIQLRAVVDFLDFRFFPIFNLADICVVCGSGMLFLYLLFWEPKIAEKKKLEEKSGDLQL